MTTPADVLHKIFTNNNPVSGSPPPPHMAWAVFANGTAFYTEPTDALPVDASFDAIGDAGRAALRELGPVIAGTAAADFTSRRLDNWFPDEPVWFITYDRPSIVTILVTPGNDIRVGLEGRSRRQRDHDEGAIVLVRRFTGEIKEIH